MDAASARSGECIQYSVKNGVTQSYFAKRRLFATSLSATVSQNCRFPSLCMAASTFMEEDSVAPVFRSGDDMHLLWSIRLDERGSTKSECSVLTFASDPNFTHAKHQFQWMDFEMQGDMLCYTSVSDCSNDDWGYKFMVIGSRKELWAWLVLEVYCQTAEYSPDTIQVLHTVTSAEVLNESVTIDVGTAPPHLDLLNRQPMRLLDSIAAVGAGCSIHHATAITAIKL
ncbi:zinc finger ZZ-type and EF-hand domain-containing protein 1-like [Acanthaster planci]|uniref:Zinc finger ZZ-type and EF-hand domain-containing protein 1-like n=1 Tax=Acanthaster planci TaxID=133434 RepID=A0A8B7Z8F6_ACAPL|nr:zinc finger ZZ-type and EF-hand domain-containing protein 1-like [Acanthaster planci]